MIRNLKELRVISISTKDLRDMTPATHTHTKLVGLNLCESLRLVLGCPDGGSRGFWGFFELSGVCGQMRTRARAHTHPPVEHVKNAVGQLLTHLSFEGKHRLLNLGASAFSSSKGIMRPTSVRVAGMRECGSSSGLSGAPGTCSHPS